ncbi:MAG: hypothetical protein AB7U20_25080 [Planctomycetaceae bacterium]
MLAISGEQHALTPQGVYLPEARRLINLAHVINIAFFEDNGAPGCNMIFNDASSHGSRSRAIHQQRFEGEDVQILGRVVGASPEAAQSR